MQGDKRNACNFSVGKISYKRYALEMWKDTHNIKICLRRREYMNWLEKTPEGL
jgi:hypothetical protein